MLVTVVVCDWCLEGSPVPQASTVELGGFSFDLCPAHAARWSELSGGLSGGPSGSADAGAPGIRVSSAGAARAKRTSAKAGSRVTSKSVAAKPTRAKAKAGGSAATKRAAKVPAGRAATRKTSAAKAPSAKASSAKVPAKGSARKLQAKASRKGEVQKSSRKLLPPVDSKAVRAWANANGIAAPSRGPLGAHLIERFLAAPVNAPARVPKATFQQP